MEGIITRRLAMKTSAGEQRPVDVFTCLSLGTAGRVKGEVAALPLRALDTGSPLSRSAFYDRH